MTTGTEIHVSIGEVKTGQGLSVLKATLGSCVGIGFLWKRKGLFGLAHCLLAKAPTNEHIISGRYVTQAIPSLLELMEITGRQRREIEAVLVGGGKMTMTGESEHTELVGVQNARAAEACLKANRIHLIHKDVGGHSGRKIRIHCATGEFTVDVIPRLAQAG